MQGLLGSWRWHHFPEDTCPGLPTLWPGASTTEPAMQAGDLTRQKGLCRRDEVGEMGGNPGFSRWAQRHPPGSQERKAGRGDVTRAGRELLARSHRPRSGQLLEAGKAGRMLLEAPNEHSCADTCLQGQDTPMSQREAPAPLAREVDQ